jgi:hypothetical protein
MGRVVVPMPHGGENRSVHQHERGGDGQDGEIDPQSEKPQQVQPKFDSKERLVYPAGKYCTQEEQRYETEGRQQPEDLVRNKANEKRIVDR